jgi:hypothetical protein
MDLSFFNFLSNENAPGINTIILLSSFIIALGIIWKLARFVFRVDNALPTLLLVADQFKKNGGSTIRDKIDDLHENDKEFTRHVEELKIADRYSLKVAEDSQIQAKTMSTVVEELIKTQIQDVQSIKDYVHISVDSIRTELHNNLLVQAQNLVTITEGDKRMARIEASIDAMLPLITRRRGNDNE